MSTITPRRTPGPYMHVRRVLAQRGVNPVLAEVVNSLDGLTDAAAHLAHVRAQVESLTAPDGTSDVMAELVAVLRSGGDLPQDAAQRYQSAREAFPAHLALVGELSQVVHAAEDDYLAHVVHGLSAMLGQLRTRLADVLARAAEVLPAVDGITSAQAAIDAGKVEQWQTLADLRAEHRHVRDAQRALLDLLEGDDGALLTQEWDTACVVAAPQTWEHWQTWQDHGGILDRSRDELTPLDLPWSSKNPDAALSWLVAHPEARPTVPSIKDALRRAEDEQQRKEKQRLQKQSGIPGLEDPVLARRTPAGRLVP